MRKLHLIGSKVKEQPGWPTESLCSTGCGNASLQLRHKLSQHGINSARTSLNHTSSKIVAESNSYLRGKLNEAEESVTFMVGKLKQLQDELVSTRSMCNEKDITIRQLTSKLDILGKKYRQQKRSYDVSSEQVKQSTHGKTDPSEFESICQKYWEELRQSEEIITELRSDNSKLREQNAELGMMLQSVKQQLYRLTDVLAHTNGKLEDIANQTSKKPTHHRNVLCSKCEGVTETNNVPPRQPTPRQVTISQDVLQFHYDPFDSKLDQPSKPIIKHQRRSSFKQETPPTMLPHEQSNTFSGSIASINNLLFDWKTAAFEGQTSPNDSPN